MAKLTITNQIVRGRKVKRYRLNITMKDLIYFCYWLWCVIYAFMYWGFWWGIINIFFPFAPVYDIVVSRGKIV